MTDFLENTELFRDATDTVRKQIQSASAKEVYKRGDFIFNEGDEGASFYALIKGHVRLVKNSMDGKEILVRFVKPNEIFAEVILFESPVYPVTAVSIDDTELLSIKKSEILILMNNADFRNEFCAMLMRRMRYLADRILYISAFDVEERFFRFLIEKYGKKYEYTINLPRKDIASSIGTIPETLSRLTMRLKQRGIIVWDDNYLTIQKDFWDNMTYD